ncbi:MAG: hypothetical protein JSR37_06135 [Verrucomicrobia bacterium]|nr:hypothetical protein [Verrucomicrobiota bacterium]MBS0636042.1 hypothetical protein [Verrucomicrobiota bacterium]
MNTTFDPVLTPPMPLETEATSPTTGHLLGRQIDKNPSPNKKVKTVEKATFVGMITLASAATVEATYQGEWRHGKWHDKNATLTLAGIGTFAGKFEDGKFVEGTTKYEGKPEESGKVKKWAFTATAGTMNKNVPINETQHRVDLKTGITIIGNRVLSATKKRSCEMTLHGDELGTGTINFMERGLISQKYEGELKYDKAKGAILRHGKGMLIMQEPYLKQEVEFVDDKEVKK